jgi:hypothetical protein
MSATRLRFEDLWPGPSHSVAEREADARQLQEVLESAPLFAREAAKGTESGRR